MKAAVPFGSQRRCLFVMVVLPLVRNQNLYVVLVRVLVCVWGGGSTPYCGGKAAWVVRLEGCEWTILWYISVPWPCGHPTIKTTGGGGDSSPRCCHCAFHVVDAVYPLIVIPKTKPS